MTIALPIEIKVREFLPKIFLAVKLLEKLNQDIIIGEKNKVYEIYKKNNGLYLISKGGPIKLFKFFKKNYFNNYLGLLDEEAPLSNIGKFDLLPRIDKKIFFNLDDYFVWNETDRKLLNKYLKYDEKILKFGHPKFDLLKYPNIKIFNNKIKKIKKRYKNLVFIPSSFVFDQLLGDKITRKFQISQFKKDHKNTKVFKKYNEIINIELNNYELFIKLLINLAKDNPKFNFVFRPHPRQSISILKKRFKGRPKNLHIIYKDIITPWIIACRLYIHYGCTSSLEASLLRKKIILYVNNKKAFLNRDLKLFESLSHSFDKYDKCYNFINNHLKKNLKNLKTSKISLKYLYNKDANKFHKKFIKYFKTKYSNKIQNLEIKQLDIFSNNNKKIQSLLSNLKKFLQKIKLINFFITKINPNFFLTKEYKKKKLNKISLKEIKETLKILKIENISNLNIKIIKISDNLFLLKKN